jgi:excisionase family DNA binding protein
MDLESAAAVLGVHYQTAYRWVRTGVLPVAKVGT